MRHTLRLVLCTVVAAVAMAGSAFAATFIIDPLQSSLNATAYAGGPPSAGGTVLTLSQSALVDTTTTSLNGSLLADIGGGNISFPGGSSIGFNNQPINVLPDANGGDATGPDPNGTGGDPGVFGWTIDQTVLPVPGFIAINTALADLSDFTAGGTALSGGTTGTFDGTQQNVLILQGAGAYNLDASALGAGVIFGTTVLAPPTLSAQNGVDSSGTVIPQNGSVTTVAGVTTITIPIYADQLVTLNGLPLDVIFSGQIVAVSVVPEPSTIAMSAIGLVVGAVAMGRRRLRRA